jgi:hypothetical protein
MEPHETREAANTVNTSVCVGSTQQGSWLETNLFEIENASALNCEYRLFLIRGLDAESEDYEKNAQHLVTRISREKRVPAIICYKDDKAYIAIPTGYPEPPKVVKLVRTDVYLDPTPGTYPLKFDKRNPETEPLCVRFLQFTLQSPFWNSKQLWQPSPGMPFFNKQAANSYENFDMYEGFTFRVVPVEGGPLCICVDITHKYVAKRFLPANLTNADFRRIKGSRCVYQYGHRWYEIRLDGYHQLKANQVKIGNETLVEYILRNTSKPYPPALISLPHDCAVLTYRDGQGNHNKVPSALCRLTYDTESPQVSRIHRETIKAPGSRSQEIRQMMLAHLRGLTFNGVPIKLSESPLKLNRRVFVTPDLKFGHNQTLSVRATPGSRHVTLQRLGAERLSLIYDKQAGYWSSGKLDRQYVILPNSVADTWGNVFLKELGEELGRLYPDSQPYEPEEIRYRDDVPKMPTQLGREILKAVDAQKRRSGFGLVIIPETERRTRGEEDKLAHLVMRQLRERDIHVAVIHGSIPASSYDFDNKWKRSTDPKVAGRLNGYLRNVAICKVLLLNRKWPFVLDTPLKAEATIGIDVKGHTAGFTFIFDNGQKIRFESEVSKDRERLGTPLVEKVLYDTMREEFLNTLKPYRSIIFQRQGRAFWPENKGMKKVMDRLKRDGTLSQDFAWAIVEIPKTSLIRFRLFEATHIQGGDPVVTNPEIGHYGKFSNSLGFVCTTGVPFAHRGCVRPLLVRKVDGNIPIEIAMEDIYALANLTWTRPEDCARDPLSVKMNDIRLREVAGEYDVDELRFGSEEEEDEEANIEISEVIE